MKKFLKVNSPDTGPLTSQLINVGEATVINFTTSTACTIFYDYVVSNNAVMQLSNITSGIPVLMNSFEKAITANPGKIVVDLESKLSSILYLSN